MIVDGIEIQLDYDMQFPTSQTQRCKIVHHVQHHKIVSCFSFYEHFEHTVKNWAKSE